MPCDESLFEFMEMRRVRADGKEERPIGKVKGRRAIYRNFHKPGTQDTQC